MDDNCKDKCKSYWYDENKKDCIFKKLCISAELQIEE